MTRLLIALLALCAFAARADEGMWIYNNFPKQKIASKYKFEPTDRWLTEARLSSVRLAGGCSGSFVSATGLVMTNHHCAHSCIEHLSNAKKNFVKEGFFAPTTKDEVKCPEVELNQLVGIEDVTATVQGATKGLTGKEFHAAHKGVLARIEKECAGTNERVRCDAVTLYHGGRYDLYKYKRFQDVRLVFAPEFAIAFFGGDPDNFMFPRFDLDVSFLRAYEDGRPARTENHFRWSKGGAKEGQLTFVSGHPGGTDRDLTLAELEYQRDVALPDILLALAEYRGAVTQFRKLSPEHHRIAEAELFSVENSFKALRGRMQALMDRKLLEEKSAREKNLRAQVAADEGKQKLYGAAWDEIARALDQFKKMRKRYYFIEYGRLAQKSRLYGLAKTLTRYADESKKPNEERLREYRETALPTLKQHLFSRAPIYEELETFKLVFGLTKLREELGADDPIVKQILGTRSPEELAAELVKGSKLKDPAVRKQLFEGGKAAVEASDDSMIRFFRSIDGEARRLRKIYDEEISAVEKKNNELIAKARFEVEGTSNYPDATFTLRLSYGQVRGYEENGRQIGPFTYLGGTFERATGREPFKLPPSWLDAQAQLRPSTPMNFTTDNDIIGGNSGSPVFNQDLEIVGLIFDGNIHSLGGDYGFDDSVNRAISVGSEAIIEALEKIYKARRIVEELKPGGAAGAGMH